MVYHRYSLTSSSNEPNTRARVKKGWEFALASYLHFLIGKGLDRLISPPLEGSPPEEIYAAKPRRRKRKKNMGHPKRERIDALLSITLVIPHTAETHPNHPQSPPPDMSKEIHARIRIRSNSTIFRHAKLKGLTMVRVDLKNKESTLSLHQSRRPPLRLIKHQRELSVGETTQQHEKACNPQC